MSEYRYDTVQHAPGSEPTHYRAHLVRNPDDYSGDQWRFFWDGDFTVAFGVFYGVRGGTVTLTGDSPWSDRGDDTERAIQAFKMARKYGQDLDTVLTTLARRIEGNWDARFICVSLDRGYDVYALTYDGDPDNEFRDTIEAVYHGDVYRPEVEEWMGDGVGWMTADDCEEWYGEDRAQAEFEKAFPLTEVPVEVITGENAA